MTMQNVETKMLDLGHSTVPWQTVGTGPDVVFVHGWPLHSATWRHVVERLQDRFTCHLIDLPGAGGSRSSKASPIDLRGHAVTLRDVIDRMGLESYALVAHDSGALFARMVAADDPRVVGVLMGNTEIPGHAPTALKLLGLLRLPFAQGVMRVAMGQRSFRRSQLGYGSCFHDTSHIEGEFVELFVDPLLASREAYDDEMRLIGSFDVRVVDELSAVHARMHCPVKLVWGAQDPWFPLEHARGMVDQFAGGAELVVVQDAKLLVHEEHPGRFADETAGFLGACFAGRQRASC
jgi:haloalkane dehalogenase